VVIPVYDENHVYHISRPWSVWLLVGLNVLVLAYVTLLQSDAAVLFTYALGLVPAFISGAMADARLALWPYLTLLTYMFVHGSWVHLAANMIFLWVLGDNIESAIGHVSFVVFYLLCGVAGGLAHVAGMPASAVPLVGASGAIAGVVGAYLLLHPWARITVLVLGFMTFTLQAYWVLGAWIAWQVASVMLFQTFEISYWSHIGGLLAGAALILVLRKPGIPILQ